MAAPTFEATRRGYRNLWQKAEVRPERRAAVDVAARRILRDRARYEAVERKTGVPWFWIACAHDRESSGDFRGVLHNGEHIIGTGRKTRLVPKGRGPFSTWEQAAIDALAIKKLGAIENWSIERILYEWERFNGFGYYGPGVNSPYLWADTNLEQRGKYVADGKFDRSADDKQRGCAAVLKRLCALDPTINARVNGTVHAPPPPPEPEPPPAPEPEEPELPAPPDIEPPEPAPPAPSAKVGFWRKVTGWLTAAASAVGGFLWDYRVALVVAGCLLVGVIVLWLLAGPKLKLAVNRLLDHAIQE